MGLRPESEAWVPVYQLSSPWPGIPKHFRMAAHWFPMTYVQFLHTVSTGGLAILGCEYQTRPLPKAKRKKTQFTTRSNWSVSFFHFKYTSSSKTCDTSKAHDSKEWSTTDLPFICPIYRVNQILLLMCSSYSAYYLPGTVLSVLPILTQLILMRNLWGRKYYQIHFTDEEAKTQKS